MEAGIAEVGWFNRGDTLNLPWETRNIMPKVITVTLNPSIDVTLWVDGLDQQKVNRVRKEIRQPGGKGINVARVLARSGTQTLAVGITGVANMQELISGLEAESVTHCFIPSSGGIRENLTLRVGTDTVKINRPGSEITAEELLKLKGVLKEEISSGDICVFGGTIPGGITAGRMQSLVAQIKDCGAKLAVDSESVPLSELYLIKPWLIKPNIHEFCRLVGREITDIGELIMAAKDIISGGVGNILLSMGPDGLLAVTANEAVRARVPPVKVCSTVGAGDSALAGFIAAHMAQMGLEQCVRMAAAYGTASVTAEATGLASGETAMKYYEMISATAL